MPSFDIVSEFDKHEATNAVDQANREVSNRFDFKGTGATFEQNEHIVTLKAQQQFQLKQMMEILRLKLSSRGINVSCIDTSDVVMRGQTATLDATLRQGIEAELAKKIVTDIKNEKLKVQAAIQGEKVRVSGKKRDILQQAIALLKSKNYDLPLQFNNFRD